MHMLIFSHLLKRVGRDEASSLDRRVRLRSKRKNEKARVSSRYSRLRLYEDQQDSARMRGSPYAKKVSATTFRSAAASVTFSTILRTAWRLMSAEIHRPDSAS